MILDFDLFNLFIGVVGIVIGVIGLAVAYKTKWEAKYIAERSGAFRESDINVAVFGSPLGEAYPHNTEWFFIHPGSEDDRSLFPLRFTVYNAGDATSKSADMTIQVSHSCFPAAQENVKFIVYPSVFQDRLQQSIDRSANFTRLTFVLPPINPKSQVDITIPFSFAPTIFRQIIPVHTTDGTTIIFPFTYFFAYKFSIFLSVPEITPVHLDINITVVEASSIQDGIQKYKNLRSNKPTKENIQSKQSFLRRLLRKFFESDDLKVRNFLVCQPESETTVNNKTLYIMPSAKNFCRTLWKDDNEFVTYKIREIKNEIDFSSLKRRQNFLEDFFN